MAMGSEMVEGKLTERQRCRGESDMEYFDVILFEK
jgi:hypothetical protein